VPIGSGDGKETERAVRGTGWDQKRRSPLARPALAGPILAVLFWAVLVLIALFLAGCGDGRPREEAQLRIGLNLALSGDLAGYGLPALKAVELAAKEVNRSGGLAVNGRKHKIVLFVQDNQGRPDQSISAARQLIHNDQVAAMIGPSISGNAIPTARVAEQAGVVLLSPMSTNPATTQDKKYVFRAVFTDPFQGRVMAEFALQELKAGRAAVLFDAAGAYSQGIAAIFRRIFESGGGKVVAFETYTTDDRRSFSVQLSRIREARAQVLYLPNYELDVELQAGQARELGIQAVLLGSDAWDFQKYSSWPEFQGSYLTVAWSGRSNGGRALEFIQAYARVHRSPPPPVAALAYDCLGLVTAAAAFAGGVERKAIRDGLYLMEPYPGVTGAIDFIDSGDPLKTVEILKIENGEARLYIRVQPDGRIGE